MDIPSDVYVRYYRTLKTIAADHQVPLPIERTCKVFWGPTGTGKSRTAWEQAGPSAYTKCPRTKWWDGYRDQESVIIDEFRGAIDISHLLRWLDRYPVNVEIKGGTVALNAKYFWITSNIHPLRWYEGLDLETYQALERRLEIVNFL